MKYTDVRAQTVSSSWKTHGWALNAVNFPSWNSFEFFTLRGVAWLSSPLKESGVWLPTPQIPSMDLTESVVGPDPQRYRVAYLPL